ncbi:MAG: DNA repair protein RecN [Proteobacteria bacterium]|nr:DNA repair protein RecN [Pseudomonadota bacterium]
MLRHLRVTNFAILSDVAMDFGDGFVALTGETGAGKSLIVEAVNLLRGGRASADIPRAGAKEAVVEAIFEIPGDLDGKVRDVLKSAGLPEGEGDVLIRRVIQRGGRSRTYVNGALTTAKRLAELGSYLVELSGQHQHQGLADARRHRDILDAFARNDRELETMRAAHAVIREAESAIAELGGDPAQLADRIEYLRFQLEEIEAAQLSENEDEELDAERKRLQSVDRLDSAARRAESLLYAGEGAAVESLGLAARELERLIDVDRSLTELFEQLEEARVLAEETARALRQYAENLDSEPARLAEVEDRLALLHRLQRKHGGDVAAVLDRAGQLRAELERLEHRDERLAELERARATAENAARSAAAVLTESRRRAADQLSDRVGAALAELGMVGAMLSVALEPRPLGPDGADRVEFLLASNKGEDAKALARIASGGELSRIMLALKLCLRRADEVATYVFDEVDTGIGGATAEVVGHQIRALGDQRQVLCVTHLPQIVAFADQHFHVSKYEVDGRTETAVRTLTGKERRDEMARMLGGVEITASARAHAAAMLKAAAKHRPSV